MSTDAFIQLLAQLILLAITAGTTWWFTSRNTKAKSTAEIEARADAEREKAEAKAEEVTQRLTDTLERELAAVRSRADRLHGDLENERALSAEREREMLKLRAATDLTELQRVVVTSFAEVTSTLGQMRQALEAMERRISHGTRTPADEEVDGGRA